MNFLPPVTDVHVRQLSKLNNFKKKAKYAIIFSEKYLLMSPANEI